LGCGNIFPWLMVVIGHNPLENQVSKTSFSGSHSSAGNGELTPT